LVLQCWSLVRRLLGLIDKTEKQLVSNLRIVFGDTYSRGELKRIAKQCLYLRSIAVYDFYHYQHDLPKLRRKISIEADIAETLQTFKDNHQPAIAISPHFVCADIIGIELAQRVNHLQVISIANPGKSYQLDNQVRENYGCEITPASMHALRQAANTLKQGNFVGTGIDRAFPQEKIPNDFFGKPAYLPTYYIRLALHYHVPIIYFYGEVDRKGHYHLKGHAPIWLKEYPTQEEEVLENSKTILQLTEEAIRKHPEQWAMFHPLWADQFEEEERE
jgi:lauroyl/myristoyl acyltransferase